MLYYRFIEILEKDHVLRLSIFVLQGFWISKNQLGRQVHLRALVENSFPFRLRPTAPQTDEPSLRKVEHTESTLFSPKTQYTFTVIVSI